MARLAVDVVVVPRVIHTINTSSHHRQNTPKTDTTRKIVRKNFLRLLPALRRPRGPAANQVDALTQLSTGSLGRRRSPRGITQLSMRHSVGLAAAVVPGTDQ